MAGRLRVTLHKSPFGYTAEARGTVRALGLHRIGQTVEIADDAAMRGQVRAIRFLVRVEEVPAATSAKGSKARDEETNA
ncbi:MAG: 50S ribosomal protein L30 [Candidatus Limnocylindrales bacterium]